MRKLIDNVSKLEWITFDRAESAFIDEYSEYIRQINTWSNDKHIKKYISEDPVGNEIDFLFKMVSDSDLYIAKNGDEVAALVLLGHTRPLVKDEELFDYIANKQHLDKPITDDISYEEYLDEEDVMGLLKDREKNNIYVEYIMINPKYHGRGIATRFYRFLQDNLDFFGGHDSKFLQVSIKESNIPSRKAVIKNGFKRMKPTTKFPNYSTYYLHLRENIKDKENERL